MVCRLATSDSFCHVGVIRIETFVRIVVRNDEAIRFAEKIQFYLSGVVLDATSGVYEEELIAFAVTVGI